MNTAVALFIFKSVVIILGDIGHLSMHENVSSCRIYYNISYIKRHTSVL